MTARQATDNRRYPDQPIVGIGVTIWRGDKVLLVRRKNPPRKGQWGLPGGRQHLGETIMETAVREAREETGLTVTPLGIVTAIDAIARDAVGKPEYHYTIVEVAAESSAGEPQAGSDVSELCWATIGEIEKLCEWPEVARVVRLAMLQKTL